MTPPMPSGFEVQSRRSEIGIDPKSGSPPTAAYVSKDDLVWVMSANNGGGGNITVNYRLLLPDGSIAINQQNLTMLNSRSAQYQSFRLPECFILSIAAVTNYGGAGGLSFLQLIISRSNPSFFFAAQILTEGYASGNQAVSWPDGVQSDSSNCVGAIRSITGSTPGAGNNISETVPANAKWRLISFRYTLTTSAVVGGRVTVFTVDDGTNIITQVDTGGLHAASTAQTYNFTLGYAGLLGINGLALAVQCPAVVMNAGYRLRTVTSNMDAGDQYSAVQYLVEEWLQP